MVHTEVHTYNIINITCYGSFGHNTFTDPLWEGADNAYTLFFYNFDPGVYQSCFEHGHSGIQYIFFCYKMDHTK